MELKSKVSFVCVRNSYRSQMAEAIAKVVADDVLEAHSAGPEMKDVINPRFRRDDKGIYGVDMTERHRPNYGS